MKEKILAYLKTKIGGHAGGIQESFLNGIAEKLSKTIKEEDKIQTEITDVILEGIKSSYDVFQSEIGRRVTEAQSTALKNFREKHGLDENGKPISKPPDDKDVPPIKDEPEWFKGFRVQQEKKLTELQGKIDSYENAKTQEQLLGKVHSKLKEKGIPLEYIGKVAGRNLKVESEDKVDAIVSEIESDFNSFSQAMAERGVHITIPPTSVGGGREGEQLGKEIATKRNARASEGVPGKKI